MQIDPFILAFSALTVIATIWMGFWSARKSKTAHDFFVAGRSVSVGWNASAISGEYLSAASFMGVAGMVMSSGYDALWYPVCYACGYLFLLLFIAGPLRRFGAYTIPDFAEGRFDSPLFRKIAVVFVLFIGFFYTMPQMKGAGTTLAYIFQDVDLRGTILEFLAPHNEKREALKGFPYWAGVVLVGAVITLNVALGGMKGITLVQAFQYWAKMFAISVPVFVLMTVYGHYGKQLDLTNHKPASADLTQTDIGTNQYIFTATGTSTSLVNARGNPAFGLALEKPPSLMERFQILKRRLIPFRVSYAEKKYELSELISIFLLSQSMPDANFKTVRSTLFWNGDSQPGITWGTPHRMTYSQIGNSIRDVLTTNNLGVVNIADRVFALVSAIPQTTVAQTSSRRELPALAPNDKTWLNPFGPLTSKAAKAAKLSADESKPYSLLYTYSLIIALVCGTAGLPHILVRFYTNPDGVAAKRTTMWVMILIGVFYVFPPIFGVMGRNLLPDLYSASGAKGTDKIVLELPRILNETREQAASRTVESDARTNTSSANVSSKSQIQSQKPKIPWGSILSGITCAGAFAAFMSTFSGLLVSMTGALAHDVYGRMLRPKSTPDQRLHAFKFCAIVVGGIAILLGTLVEPLQINFMVGQAFAIAAASYFPLLFMSAWWRGMTMKGATAGMLTGGLLAVTAISVTSFSDLKWLPLDDYWKGHPLLRIICEQPAIWTVPLAIGLMIVVSKITRKEIPADIRMKMLVLHAPEKLGLKQEYIHEHGAH